MIIHTNKNAFLDEMTDATKFAERLPHLAPQLDIIQDIRNIGDEVNVKSDFWAHRHQEGSMGKLMACIPWEVWVMLVQLDPDIDHDKPRFMRWLRAHPEYQAYSQ